MTTPRASFIGLSLIAAAIFLEDTAVKPAHAPTRTGETTNAFSSIEGYCYYHDVSSVIYSMLIKGKGGVQKWKKVN